MINALPRREDTSRQEEEPFEFTLLMKDPILLVVNIALKFGFYNLWGFGLAKRGRSHFVNVCEFVRIYLV